MLSLIICSTHETTSTELRQNIAKTIGCAYEIVHIDNHDNKYNIFQAYNVGVERAKGDILCFIHEDIIFRTANWGQNIIEHFKENNIGALGVAGGEYIPTDLDWRFLGIGIVSLYQGYYTCEQTPQYGIIRYPEGGTNTKELTQVAVLDGVFICIAKKTFDYIHWDDQNFHGFHLYDSDICMQINKIGLNVYVCYDVLFEHKSNGFFTIEFENSLKDFFKKWKKDLPLQRGKSLSKVELDTALRIGKILYEHRFREDTIKKGIVKKNGQITYTEEEKDCLRSDVMSFYKGQIKSKRNNFRQSFDLLKHNIKNDSIKKKDKIRISYKFVWYRILFRNKLK